MGEERPSSREFEVHFILALLHAPRFCDFALEKVKPDIFTEIDCLHIYETVIALKRKNKPISFFGIYETIRRDTKLSDEKSTAMCELLKPFIALTFDTSVLDSIVDGIIPIVEEMVKERLVEEGVMTSADLHDQGKYDEVIRLWERIGRESVYRDTQSARLWENIKRVQGLGKLLQVRPGIPLGIKGKAQHGGMARIDNFLFYHGIGRGHLALFLADTNLGKSTMMLNIAVYQSLLGYNVDYYSISEMPIEYTRLRLISIMIDMPTDDIVKPENDAIVEKKLAEIDEKYPNKSDIQLYDYRANELTVSTCAYNLMMSQKEGRKVDHMIVDYLSRMRCEQQYREKRHTIAQNASDLCDLGREYDCMVSSPTQAGRRTEGGKKRKTKDKTDMAEDYDQVRTADDVLVMNETIEELSDVKGNKITKEFISVLVDKNRFGKRGGSVMLVPNRATGRMFDPMP